MMARRVAVIAVLWTLLQLYLGQRLLGFDVTPPWRLAGWLLVALMATAPWLALFAGRLALLPGRTVLSWTGYVALGVSSLLIVFVGAGDLLHVRSWLGTPLFAALVVALTGAIVSAGLWRAARPKVVQVNVPIAGLPRDLEGFRIVQLSDLHVGPTLKEAFVRRVVRTANGLAPDMVALTGDVADGFVPLLRADVAPLADLTAPYGKFFVTGNHEYYWDAPGWVQELERLGFDPLVNEHRLIARGDARMLVAGVTDSTAGGMVAGHATDLAGAVLDAPDSDVKVLLSHQPRTAYAAGRAGFDLQLSGHTHGGQYFPFNYIVRLFQPFVAGLHRLEQMWLYVSRGTGYWGPPLRLGAPAEITLLQLRRA